MNVLVIVLAVAGCSAGEHEPPVAKGVQPVQVAEPAMARSLSAKKTSKPRLCKEDTCLVPELGTDLDEFEPSGASLLPEACYDGQNYCSGGRCYECCNNTWYNANTCTWGVHFYCNGVHYEATSCWPCCE